MQHGEAAEPDSDFQRALQLLNKGATQEGEAQLRILAAKRPLHVAAHRELQRLRLSRYEHLQVLRDYQDLARELPASGDARYLLGRLLHRLDDQRDLFEDAADLDRSSPWGFQGLAWNAVVRGQFEEAFRLLNFALAAEPGHSRSRYLMIRLLLAQGRTEQARAMMTQLLRDQPDDAGFWILSAQIENREGMSGDTLAALERALKIDPHNSEARDLLLELVGANRGQAISFLAADLGAQLAEPDSRDLDDLAFMTQLDGLSCDDDALRLHARRALEAGASSPALLHEARFRPPEFYQAWKKLYQTDRFEVGAPVRELERLLTGTGDAANPEYRLQLAEAFVAAGFLDYGWNLVRELEGDLPQHLQTRRQELADALRQHKRVLARTQVLVDQAHARPSSQVAESLEAFLDTIGQVIEEETGYTCDQPEPVLGLPFVGSAVDSAKAIEGTINGYLRRFNQVMFAGRLEGAVTQAVVFTVLSGPKRVLPDLWPNDLGCTEFIGGMVKVRSEDESFGDSAGRALFGTYFIDLDVLMPWKTRLARIAEESPEIRQRILADHALPANGSAERLSMAYPGVMAEALVLRALELHGDLPVLDAVIVHEQGHLLDSFDYLPLWQRVLPNLLLIFRGGFSSRGVMAELEDTAARHALRFARSPHVVLAELVRSLPVGGNPGPHARGYKNLLARFLIYLDGHLSDFKQISPDRVLLHQLHFLTEDQIRTIAHAI